MSPGPRSWVVPLAWTAVLLDGFDPVVLGGCLPTAITLVTECARHGKAGSATTTVMTGYHVGAVRTALLGIVLITPRGWRAMFVAGALPALVLVPLIWFCAGAVFLALLSVKRPAVGLYTAVFLTGCFVFGAQVLVYAYIGRLYPDAIRATGLGWSAGIGRIGAISGPLLGGALLTAGIAYPWGFYAFAGVGALGAAAVAVVRPGHHARVRQADREDAIGAPAD
ncbi:MFS transporter [Amycolatopsis sp. NPDC024027]|uniref:MFS transporter n=1 Tax=Amycolatopsis sp. NPDC024027 TaxID=3154327 RepID=UPI0033C696EF